MALIHILDKQSDEIIGTLNKGEYSDSGSNEGKVSSSENENTFDFTALQKFDFLQKRNRLLLQDKDGFFSEYIIIYAEQNSRNQKFIKSNATFTDLQKAKIIEPQVLQGATADTASTKALEGTEWRKGKVDYNGIRTLKIEEYTNPYNLLKRIASEFGLDLRFRVAVEGSKIVRYVDLTLPDDEFDGKEVVFGRDLIGIRRIEDAQNIVTALLVLGPEQEDGKRLTALVEDNDALQRWGRNGQHLIDVYEPQITAEGVTVERLRTLGQNALQKRIDAIVTYECQAAILEHIPGKEHDKVRLDRTIRIKDEGYTPPLYLEAKVLEVREQPSTGKILDFKLGNYKEYSKTDLEAQIAGLKKQLNDKLSKLLQVSVTSSAGTIFKNGAGETDLTAVTILGGKEVDTDGLFYDYVWSKYDKNGNFVGATSGKSITVYARNIDEKETYIVTVENQGAKSVGQITVTNVNDGEQGPPGPKGDDGKTTYTWRKYADDANGTNMSDNPEGKQYLGMAFNKESPIASMNPQDYSWSAMYDTEKIEETKEIASNALDAANKAKRDAQNAQSTADGKNTVFYQATAPSTVGRKIGDVWFNTADSHKMHRFDGSNWIPAQFGTNAIANLAITNALIANGAIDNAKISNLDAGKITSGYLSSARIAAKSIDVSKLNVSTLSAITANLGTVTAGILNGVLIQGSTIKSVLDANNYTEITNNRIHNEGRFIDTEYNFGDSWGSFDVSNGKIRFKTGQFENGVKKEGTTIDLTLFGMVVKNNSGKGIYISNGGGISFDDWFDGNPSGSFYRRLNDLVISIPTGNMYLDFNELHFDRDKSSIYFDRWGNIKAPSTASDDAFWHVSDKFGNIVFGASIGKQAPFTPVYFRPGGYPETIELLNLGNAHLGIRGNSSMLKFPAYTEELWSVGADGEKWVRHVAKDFYSASSRTIKKDIEPFTDSGDALPLIRQTTVYKYRHKDDAPDDPLKAGLILEESPAIIQGDNGISVYGMSSLLWEGVKELDETQRSIIDRVAWLETENNYLKQKITLLEAKIS